MYCLILSTFSLINPTRDSMKTLTILQQITPTNSYPWQGKAQSLSRSGVKQLFPPPRSRQFRGGAKGFSGRSRDAEGDKAGEIDTKRNDGKYKNVDDDEIPEVVRNKIITRILLFVGVPLGLGLAILQALSVLSDQGLWVVPKWVPLVTTFLTFGASSLGIAYGSLSTSLDPKEEGTFLGLEQIEKNWNEMWKEENES